MPEQKTDFGDDAALDPQTEAVTEKSSILAKIRVALFVTVVIALECLAAYMYLPSAQVTAELAQGTLATASAEEAAMQDQDARQDDEEDLADQVEVDLGEFSVTAYQPISSTTLRIDFHLFGTVGREDEDEFLLLWEASLHRFRDQVILTVRSAEITDLTDAGLGLIKRRVLEKANKTLGKPLLRVVIFSEFSFLEQ